MSTARDIYRAERRMLADLRRLAKADRNLQVGHKEWRMPNGVDRDTINLLHRVTSTWQRREGVEQWLGR